jgi:D-alanyl-D-alanine carboxypeptidase
MRSDPDAARDRLAAWVDASKVPGLQYVAVSAADTLLEFAGGWADIRQRRSMSPDTTLMAYSMSKTITAVAVLQLIEGGRLSLDDPVTRFVSQSPYGPAITVRQLLSHTAGIPNPIPLRWVHTQERHDGFDEASALAAVLRRHPRLAGAPGERFRYSNIGYWLLGSIVQQASGTPFEDYVTEHVLGPLGIPVRAMSYTVTDLDRHATGYLEKYSALNLLKGLLIDRTLVGEYAGRWLEIRGHFLNGPAFGGLVGTARAFAVFLMDQLRPRSVLLGQAARALLYQPQQARGGAAIAMTLGWHVREVDGLTAFFKEGGGGGFHCMMRVYPAAGLASVLMTNATGFDVGKALDAVDRHLR